MVIPVLTLLLLFSALTSAFFAGWGFGSSIRGWWINIVPAVIATVFAWSAMVLP